MNMNKYALSKLFLSFLVAFGILGRVQQLTAQTVKSKATNTASGYSQTIENWHQNRIADLKTPNGWLNLEGLFWLHKGSNSFGASAGKDCRYEGADNKNNYFPSYLGDFIYQGDSVIWVSANSDSVKIDGEWVKAKEQKTVFTKNKNAAMMSYRSFVWNIIQREDKVGIRFRNLKSATLLHFKGIDRFAVNEKWKVKAILNPPVQSQLMIMNVLGQNTATKNAGKLFFKIEGKEYSLDVIDEGGPQYFITFADATSGKTTYGAGRFIELTKPDANGLTEIDFNKAYNPPCAFTAFATCPLPPPQNRLPIAITAGEKNYGHH